MSGGIPLLRVVSWVKASEADVRRGLLGFVSIEYGLLVLDGIVVRRTAEGRITLSFPARTDRGGRRHPYLRPRDDDARRRIETAILGRLAEEVESP